MNILFCGDHNAEDGILITTLSLLKHVKELHLYILTLRFKNDQQNFEPFSKEAANFIRSLLVKANPVNTLELIDCQKVFEECPPDANINSRFTPYAMLRIYADEISQIPDRILYLDDDVIIRDDLSKFYNQDISDVQMVGVLDYWGHYFFHNIHSHRLYDYLNSGVLLLNLGSIRQDGVFNNIRYRMRVKRMFFPDQSALNKLITKKRAVPRRYNEQYRLHDDTVIQHFTTSFRFKPYFHTITVKPWDIEKMHNVLHLHEYDDLLNQYSQMINIIHTRERKNNTHDYSNFLQH